MKTATFSDTNETFEQKRILKTVEIIILFVGTPIVLWVSIPAWIKGIWFIFSILYVSWLMFKKEKLNFGEKKLRYFTKTLTHFGLKLGLIITGSTIFIYFYDRDSLFNIILSKPLLWLGFSIFYVVFSVIPQEIIYRYFFLKRYRTLFKNKLVLTLTNALLFSLAHIFFNSWLVLVFTFVGGILFFLTYKKTHSLWLVILEHSLYGIWLYTVGFAELFKFAM